MVRDTLPAISETGATGEIAELYADIRETLNVSAINSENLTLKDFAKIPSRRPIVNLYQDILCWFHLIHSTDS